MVLLYTFVGALLATTLMTIFSYGWSYVTKTETKEPELLNRLINDYPLLPFHPSYKSSPGWVIHYLIGWSFTVGFYWIWNAGILSPTLFNGLAMGAMAGIMGIMGWIIMFSVHKRPPEIIKKSFYFQLFIAHILFGAGAYIAYFYIYQ